MNSKSKMGKRCHHVFSAAALSAEKLYCAADIALIFSASRCIKATSLRLRLPSSTLLFPGRDFQNRRRDGVWRGPETSVSDQKFDVQRTCALFRTPTEISTAEPDSTLPHTYSLSCSSESTYVSNVLSFGRLVTICDTERKTKSRFKDAMILPRLSPSFKT